MKITAKNAAKVLLFTCLLCRPCPSRGFAPGMGLWQSIRTSFGVRLELLKLTGGFQPRDADGDPLQVMAMAPLHPAPSILCLGWRDAVTPAEWSVGTLGKCEY